MDNFVKELKLYYLMLHDESDCYFICEDNEVDKNLEIGCFIVSQGYNLTALIGQGANEARKAGFEFHGYKQTSKEGIKRLYPKQNKKEATVKTGTVNPVQLKHNLKK